MKIIKLLFIGFWCATLSGCQSGCSKPDEPPKPKYSKWVALTLDDGPLTHYYTYADPSQRIETIQSLIGAINGRHIPAILFAIGRESELPEQKALLQYWINAGIEIGNHTYNHVSFNGSTGEQWGEEIRHTNDVLKPLLKQPIRYFRYPYLQEGETPEREKLSNAVVAQSGLKNARITIGLDDWTFNEKYMALEAEKNWAARYEVGQAYLADVRKRVTYWDSVSVALEGRSVKHVIMFHANRINRDYLGQILDEMQAKGYGFISLDEAYQDPIYQEPDEWGTPVGVSFLEHIKQTRLLQGKPITKSASING